MFDFIKSNKKVFGLITIGIILIFLIFAVFLFGSSSAIVEPGEPVLPGAGEDREFPQGQDPSNVFGPMGGDEWVDGEKVNKSNPHFRAITKEPVAGALVYDKIGDTIVSPKIRYVTVENGHIFDADLDIVGGEDKISDKTVANIGEVEWDNSGSSVMLRYYNSNLSVVNSTIGSFMRGSSTDNSGENISAPLEFKTRQLENNIRASAFSPDGTQIFYLVTEGGGTKGYLESVITGTNALVWESIFTTLSVSWESDDSILIYTNPSSEINGVIWKLNPNTTKSQVLVGDELALAGKLNPAGDKLLFSIQEEKGDVFSLRILDMDTGDFNVLPLSTMVDKCTWGGTGSDYVYCAVPRGAVSGDFLERWYMGTEHSDDLLWRIDSNTNTVKELIDPNEEVGVPFDMIDLQTDSEEEYLVFRAKVNNALWALKLPEKEVIEEEEGEEEEEVEE